MALLVPLGHGGDGLVHGGGLQQGDGAAAEAAAGHAGAVHALDGRGQRDLQEFADIWVTPMTFRCLGVFPMRSLLLYRLQPPGMPILKEHF